MIEPQRTPASGVLKVSAQSNPNSVAGALAGVLREKPTAELQAIGAGAINQAVKAIAIARSYLQASEIDLVCVPEFTDVEIEGNVRTAIRLLVERRAPKQPAEPKKAAPPKQPAPPKHGGGTS